MSTHRSQAFLGLAAGLALAIGGSAVAAQEESSPAARSRGKAVVEYRDKDIHVVAAYNYSQRNHDSRWIMIDSALSTTATDTIKRSDIAIRTPEGREIPLATQEQLGEDINRIKALLQNARVVHHDVLAYFPASDYVEDMRLFTMPGEGVVSDEFVVGNYFVAAGRLFFTSPTGAWEEGTYTLVVRHENGTAELPIRLE